MRVACWNCRGAPYKKFYRHSSDMLNQYRLDEVFLLETRVSSVRSQKLRKLGGLDVFAVGRS